MNFSPKVNLEVSCALTFSYENEGNWQISGEFNLFG